MAELPINPFSTAATAALALPAAAYLTAKWNVDYDVYLVSRFFGSAIDLRWSQFRDRMNMFYYLEYHAQKSSTANNIFIYYDGVGYTFAQSYDKALRYGQWMKTKFGVQPNEVVAMDFMNSANFVWVWMGLWSIGAKPAFINYNLTSTPLLHSIRTSGSRIILIDPEIEKAFTEQVRKELSSNTFRKAGPVEAVVFSKELEAEANDAHPIRQPDSDRANQKPSDMAILIYTSGTTGLPKPAIVSWHKCHLASGFMYRWLPMTKKDVTYTAMPLYHSSAAILAFLAALNGGAALAIGHRFNRRRFFDECRQYNATIMQYVGETCRYLLSLPPSAADKDHKLRTAYGNGMRPDVWNKFKDRFNITTVCEFYAATEAPAGMWNRSSNNFSSGAVGRNGRAASLVLRNRVSIIRLDKDTSLPVRDPKTGLCQEVEYYEGGELIYKLNEKQIEDSFQGYYGNEKASDTKVLRNVFYKGDAWFSTGDIMRFDENWRWYFVDRIGDTFRWKSENVSTAEVAEVLGAAEGVMEANVYGVSVPGHDGRAGCAALILDAKKSAADHKAVLTGMARHAIASLPRYAVPVFVRLSRSMVQTGTMKQQKTGLRDEGIDPAKVSGDMLFWLKPGTQEYVPFDANDFQGLQGGQVKL